MKCKNCGGTMIGDGYTTALHCEFVDLPDSYEADGAPLYCDLDEKETEGEESSSRVSVKKVSLRSVCLFARIRSQAILRAFFFYALLSYICLCVTMLGV